MIRHIVLFKLKEFDTDKERSEVLKLLKINLEALKTKIKEIQFLEIGVNITRSDSAFDIALNSEFLSLTDLEKYRIHPNHKKVVELLREYTVDRVVTDYNI